MSEWYVKHRKAAKNLYALGLGVLYLLGIVACWPSVAGVFLLSILYILAFAAAACKVDIAIAKRTTPKLKIMDDLCDPYPLKEELEFQLAYTKPGAMQHALLTSYSATLSCIGQPEQMLQVLESINIDQYNSIPPMGKALYYNNLACALIQKGSLTAAAVWLGKVEQLLPLIKKADDHHLLQQAVLSNRTEIALKRGEYDQVVAMLENLTAPTRRAAVGKAMLGAKLAIAMEQTDVARSHLNYVIFNGNRLAVVEEAKALMATLTTEKE